MKRVTRQNIGGGILGKALHVRSDLEAYHKGNIQQSNFIATPFGGVERRQPSAWLGAVPTRDGVAPSSVRGFSFVVSIDEK